MGSYEACSTSEQRQVRGAGAQEASQEPEQLLHEELHILRALRFIPGRQHRLQQAQSQDLTSQNKDRLVTPISDLVSVTIATLSVD